MGTCSGKNLVFYVNYAYDDPLISPGLLPLIYILREKGHKVIFVTNEEELLKEVRSKNHDMACLSTYSSNLLQTLNLATEIKKIRPSITTTIGGFGVHSIAGKLIEHQDIDLAVEGEADIIFPEILRSMNGANSEIGSTTPYSERSWSKDCIAQESMDAMDPVLSNSTITDELGSKIKNSTFTRKISKAGEPIELQVPLTNFHLKTCSGRIVSVNDVSAYPLTHWSDVYRQNKEAFERFSRKWFPFTLEEFVQHCHSYPTEAEANDAIGISWDIVKAKQWTSLALYGQRGCPWGHCAFCCIKYVSKRKISVDKLIALLNDATQNDIKSVIFTDDIFVQNRKRTIELCRKIRDKRLNEHLQFLAQTAVGTADRSVLASMEDANFIQLMVGVETLLPEKAEYLGKTYDGESYVKQAVQMINDTLDVDLQLNLFFILCTPKSSFNEISLEILEISRVVKEAYETRSKIPLCSFLTQVRPLMGTELVTREAYDYYTLHLSTRPNGQKNFVNFPTTFVIEKNMVHFCDLMEKEIRSPRARGYLSTLTYAAETIKQTVRRMNDKDRREIEERCNQVVENISTIEIMKVEDLIICLK